jgi:hypothetical protein
MREVAIYILVASVAYVLGAPAPFGGTLPVARDTTSIDTSLCTCPRDGYGSFGRNINSGSDWYQCAYPKGACTWATVGFDDIYQIRT